MRSLSYSRDPSKAHPSKDLTLPSDWRLMTNNISCRKFGLEIALNIDKPFYPMYTAIDFSRESINKIIESIKDALDSYRVLTGGTGQAIPIVETELTRKKNATSAMRRSIEETANQAPRTSADNKKKLTQ